MCGGIPSSSPACPVAWVLHHPVVGRLTLDWSFLTCTADPDQQLITLTAEHGTPSHARLRILAS